MTFETDPNRYLLKISVDKDDLIETIQWILNQGHHICELREARTIKIEEKPPLRRIA